MSCSLCTLGGRGSPRSSLALRSSFVLLWGVIVVASTHNSNHILRWGF